MRARTAKFAAHDSLDVWQFIRLAPRSSHFYAEPSQVLRARERAQRGGQPEAEPCEHRKRLTTNAKQGDGAKTARVQGINRG